MNSKTFLVVSGVLAVLLSVLGAAALLVCVIFLFSSDLRDVTGAGLGFVGGTILLGSGTIALALITTRSSSPSPSDTINSAR